MADSFYLFLVFLGISAQTFGSKVTYRARSSFSFPKLLKSRVFPRWERDGGRVHVRAREPYKELGEGSEGIFESLNENSVNDENDPFFEDVMIAGLKEELRDLGLSTKGTKAQLVERLLAAQTQQPKLRLEEALRQKPLDLEPKKPTKAQNPFSDPNDNELWVSRTNNLEAGTVLITEKHGHFDHFYVESVVLILENDPEKGTVGLLIDKGTPWEVGEMAPVFEDTLLHKNPLNMGGGDGPDKLLMLHRAKNINGAVPIGKCGIYIGGVSAAVQLTEEGSIDPKNFHFFFKRCEWLPGQLQKEVDQGVWETLKVSPKLLLVSKSDRKRRLWNDIRRYLNVPKAKPVNLE